MNIAIDISPLKTGHYLSHRVRGTGQYLENLRSSLEKYFPENKYIYFTRDEKTPKADVIHYPYFEPFFLTLPFGISKKSVVTVHDLTPFVFPTKFPAGIKGKIRWRVQRMNLKKAGVIITDSNSSKKDIVRFAGVKEDSIEVVYLAASESFGVIKDKTILAKVKSKFNLPDKFALYVGDVTWNKNLPRLLEASKIAKVPIVMAGKAIAEREFDASNPWNMDRVKITKFIDSNDNVITPGYVSNEELTALYNLATVFIMPSIYEGFGLPILEAMACGCPVVTTKCGSIPEIAGEAALYVDEESAQDIASGIIRVYEDSDLRDALSKKGIEQSSKFTWKKTAEQTIEAYKKILE